MLAANQPENVQQVPLTDEASSPTCKTALRSLVNANIVASLL
jgi:hypothetical protein